MIARLGFIRYKSYGLFASLLAFEAKVEVTQEKAVLASSWDADGWYSFPVVHGSCLQPTIRCNAQDKQNLKKYALSKKHCNLYAIFGIILCTELHSSEQSHCPMYFH